jgi:hypothetical protein
MNYLLRRIPYLKSVKTTRPDKEFNRYGFYNLKGSYRINKILSILSIKKKNRLNKLYKNYIKLL